jgi:hypothetical protein
MWQAEHPELKPYVIAQDTPSLSRGANCTQIMCEAIPDGVPVG